VSATDTGNEDIPSQYLPILRGLRYRSSGSELSRDDKRSVLALFRGSGLGARHVSRTGKEDLPPKWADTLVRVIAAGGDPNGSLLVLCGEPGTGKTQMAAQLILRSCAHVYARLGTPGSPAAPRYTRAMDLYLDIRSSYNRDGGPTERDLVLALCRPHTLVVDELNERGGSDWEDRLLAHIVDRRYADKLHTLLICNVYAGQDAAADICARLGPKISDRLRETGCLLHCVWPSFRTQPSTLTHQEARQ
jgi:DNA replication protein DnaC